MALRYNERTGMFDEVPEDPRINSFTFDGNPIRYKDESVTFKLEVQDAERIFINDIEVPASSSTYSYPLSNVGLQNFVLRIENGGNQKAENLQIKVLDVPTFKTYGSFCRIECAPIPYKHRHSERFKVLSCKIELFNSSIGHFAG